jgi:hypothetical protein
MRCRNKYRDPPTSHSTSSPTLHGHTLKLTSIFKPSTCPSDLSSSAVRPSSAAVHTTSTMLAETPSLHRRRWNVRHPLSLQPIRQLSSLDDAASASARVKSDIPGRGKEAQKAGEEGMESVRARAQSMVSFFKTFATAEGASRLSVGRMLMMVSGR